jgi:hypothetical protein
MKPGPAISAASTSLARRLRDQRRDDPLGQLARVRAERLGELHRDVARDVAVGGDLQALQRDGRDDEFGVGALERVCDLRDISASRASRVCLCAGSMLVEGFVGGGRKRRPAGALFKRAFQGSQNFNGC